MVAGVPLSAAEVELQQGAAADESDLLEWGRGQSAAPHLRSWPQQLATPSQRQDSTASTGPTVPVRDRLIVPQRIHG